MDEATPKYSQSAGEFDVVSRNLNKPRTERADDTDVNSSPKQEHDTMHQSREGVPQKVRDALRAYSKGLFPMSDSATATEVIWIDSELRGILPLDAFHASRSLRKKARQGRFEIRVNSEFRATVQACADRAQTWINSEIMDLYVSMHRFGFAHSIECWADGSMVGGLFGVSIGAAFFGESMFSTSRDASKLALMWLVARLNYGGFRLLDTQFATDHLMSVGAIEINKLKYHERLKNAIGSEADFWKMPVDVPFQEVLQLITRKEYALSHSPVLNS